MCPMLQEKHFSEFDGLSKEQWLAQVEKDLKGKSPMELHPRWQDLDVDPFASWEDSTKRPFVFRKNREWLFRQRFDATNEKTFNGAVLEALNEGVNNIELQGPAICKHPSACLKGVHLDYVRTDFQLGAALMHGFKEDFEAMSESAEIQGSWNFDPLNQLYRNRAFYESKEKDFAFIAKLEAEQHLKNFDLIEVKASEFHNQGAYASTEVALALAVFNEYLGVLEKPELHAGRIVSTLGVGVNYFLELTKLRSYRKLASAISSEYGFSGSLFINAEGGVWRLSAFDTYTNLLRTCTQAMAASIGGADAIMIPAFDQALESSHKFANHLARMQHHLLAEESYLNKVMDPSGGSYFLEKLANQLEQKAWDTFGQIEKHGGFIKALEDGFVDHLINKDRKEQEQLFAANELKVLGVNYYPNTKDSLKASINRKDSRLTLKSEMEGYDGKD